MYNLFFLLSCVILAILFGKLINIEIPNNPRALARSADYVGRGNFTYFYVHYHGPIMLNLTSLSGDADLYISDTNMYPTYEPESYSLYSATCGKDIVEIPDSFESPIAVAVYGYAESSDFLLEIYENPKSSYPYKNWVSIERDLAHSTADNVQKIRNVDANMKDDSGNDKGSSNTQVKKKKKSRNSSNIPGVFSVLEILQLIFL